MKSIAVLVAFLVVVGLAIWIGVEMRHDPGYVMINFKGWSVQTSVWLMIAAALVVFIVIYLLIWAIGVTIRLPSHLRNWHGSKNERKAIQLTNLGLCELAEGRWVQAERSLVRGINNNDAPFVNYIAAARAAQAQGEYQRRDDYLGKAHKKVRGSKLAVGITQAQLELSGKQWEKARITLQHLQSESPKHPFVLELLARLYVQLHEWDQLKLIFPDLKKQKALDAMLIEGLEEKLYKAELITAAKEEDPQTLVQAWKKLPRQWRHDSQMRLQYIRCMLEQGCDQAAIPEIEAVLKQDWHADLVREYSLLSHPQPSKQLAVIEDWAQRYEDNSEVYLACARVASQQKLWGKAKDYLDQSIKIAPSSEAYQLLGAVFEHQDEEALAMECYRQGLELMEKPAIASLGKA